ncbi:hypothetical protein B9Z55_026979 [Caenorhabditis nigoni]|uniref:Uncharacterized protein n=1 Tax=Caenorhabditis nigoni TaxID=1611254 RepID=A0A2G5SI59_9PELO|nr:hypothetical protein B9Z55_026979 [Caenorhabditis nigoni]
MKISLFLLFSVILFFGIPVSIGGQTSQKAAPEFYGKIESSSVVQSYQNDPNRGKGLHIDIDVSKFLKKRTKRI